MSLYIHTQDVVSYFRFVSCSLTARHRVLPSGNLQIEAVTSADQGVYRCIAVNPTSLDRLPASNTIRLSVITSEFNTIYDI